MDSQERDSSGCAEGCDSQRALEPVLRFFQAESLSYETLSRMSHKKRTPENAERIEMLEDPEVVFIPFSEAEARVENYFFHFYSCLFRHAEPGFKIIQNLFDRVFVMGVYLHILRSPPYVGKNQQCPGISNGSGQSGIETEPRDIVDDVRSCLHGFTCHSRLVRVC